MAHKTDDKRRNVGGEGKKSEHEFGDAGWGGSRTNEEGQASSQAGPEPPEPVHSVPEGPDWQNRFVQENADKIGQAGGQPVVQRGSSGSGDGFEHEEQSLGDTGDLSPRGGVGIRETEDWPDSTKSAKGNKPSREPASTKKD